LLPALAASAEAAAVIFVSHLSVLVLELFIIMQAACSCELGF
jgi:hypothetical protein